MGERRVDSELIIRLYPSLEDLYIPQAGEIISWGKGCAIVTQSPLDSLKPLMVISLNGGIHGPFEVKNGLGMGPFEKASLENQEKAIEYYDRNYNARFSRLFELHPDVKKAWEEYRDKSLLTPSTS